MSVDGLGGRRELVVKLAVPWRLLAFTVVPLLFLVSLSFLNASTVLSSVGIAALVLPVACQLWFNRSRNARGPVVVLDQEGLRVHGHPLVAWSDIDRVTVGGFRVGRSRLMTRLATLQYGEVVAFIPKSGVSMPPPPGGFKREPGGWESKRHKAYGSNLTVVPSLFDVTTHQLTTAAQEIGGLPVEHTST